MVVRHKVNKPLNEKRGDDLGGLSILVLAVAVAVGEVAAAGAGGVRWGRGDEETQERVLPDHGLERVVLSLEDYLEAVDLVGGIAFQEPLWEGVRIGATISMHSS